MARVRELLHAHMWSGMQRKERPNKGGATPSAPGGDAPTPAVDAPTLAIDAPTPAVDAPAIDAPTLAVDSLDSSPVPDNDAAEAQVAADLCVHARCQPFADPRTA